MNSKTAYYFLSSWILFFFNRIGSILIGISLKSGRSLAFYRDCKVSNVDRNLRKLMQSQSNDSDWEKNHYSFDILPNYSSDFFQLQITCIILYAILSGLLLCIFCVLLVTKISILSTASWNTLENKHLQTNWDVFFEVPSDKWSNGKVKCIITEHRWRKKTHKHNTDKLNF